MLITNKMRRKAFVLMILGFFILIIFLDLPAKKISSSEELLQFQENQKLMIEGQVIKESFSGNYKILYLDNELRLECPLPCSSFIGKNISAVGFLERYNRIEKIKVLKINSESGIGE